MNRLPKEPSPDGAPFEEGDGNGNSLKKVSLSGMVLVACPWVTDPAYNRSVFLIIEQNENGTIGVVLNKPMALDPKPLLNFLFKGESISEGSELGHFNFGGPNNGPILAIHSESALAEGGNSQGVYLSAQVDTLRQLAEHSPEHLRWIIGHANWEKSQLEQEIIDGNWFVVPAVPEIVFEQEQSMWEKAIAWYGESILSQFPGVRSLPASALCN